MKKILVFLVVTVFFGWFIHIENKRQQEIDKIGLEDLNLQLTGIVDTVIEGNNYHGYGIIRLKIIKSNLKEYDPCLKQPFYFCIIRDGIAEIYEHTFVSKVDTVFIDTKKKIMSYTEDGKKVTGSISINADEDYYNYIRKKTIFQ